MTSALSLPKPFVRLVARGARRSVGAIFLDIEKAFDRVWHNALRNELLHMNAPVLLLRWISSFLRDRTVKVRILGHISREIAINYGVPQGSHISPLLFLLYMSKLPKLLPNTCRSLFSDDFMIYTESFITRSHLIQSNLQTSMDALTLFNSYHRIILSCTKSVRVLFERRTCNRLKPSSLIMVRSSLLRHLLSSLVSPLTLLSPSDLTSVLSPHLPVIVYISTTYVPSTSSLIRLHKSYTRSLFDYGAPATCVASPAIQLSWERIQTHFISRALSILSFIHDDRKQQHAYLPPIHDRNLYLAKRWYRRAMQQNRVVQDCIDNHTHDNRNIRCSRNTPLELIRN